VIAKPDARTEDWAEPKAGETITPNGSPFTVKLTIPVKPFVGMRNRVNCVVPFGEIDIDDGFNWIVKFGDVEGGRDGSDETLPPPPQPDIRIALRRSKSSPILGCPCII
jgi:hypothetical protein